MKIHKEGRTTILIVIVIVTIAVILAVIITFSLYNFWILTVFGAAALVVLLQTLMFFRIPQRDILIKEDGIVSPADGRIVLIQEVEVNEYLQGKRLQVSIFMNMFNVHVNWYPCAGDIVYYKYHPGAKMVGVAPQVFRKE